MIKEKYNLPLIALIIATLNSCQVNEIQAPIAPKIPFTITEHGHTRVDNYFWMRLTEEQKSAEIHDIQTQKVVNYLEAENTYLKSKLNHIEGFKKKLYEEIIGRIKQKDESVPYKSNGYWYYSRFEEGQEYPIYCRKAETLQNNEEIVLNVNEMAKGHSYYKVGELSFSENNQMLAFSVDTVSRRRYTIYFKDLKTGMILETTIPNAEEDIIWANDNQTVFYTQKDELTLRPYRIFRHKLGTDFSKDEIVFQEKDETFNAGIYKTKSKKFLVIYSGSTLTNYYKILEADKPLNSFREFSPRETGHEYSIDHAENDFYIITNWNAQNFRLMKTSDEQPNKKSWIEVIAHRPHVLLESLELFKNYLVVSERSKANTQLRIFDKHLKTDHYLNFGESAYTVSPSVNKEYDSELIRYGYTSLKTPVSIFEYSMRTKEKQLLKEQEVVGGYNLNDYETERLWATAKDGVQVPISLVYKKGFIKNGNSPLLLYAYGSYGYNIDPVFSSTRLSLLNRGFVFAIAHIRGGQEMGREWYEDGKMFKKMNTFTDYLACAEYLINEKYTCESHLYAQGGSAGGLLVGTILNLKPHLFHGAIAQVPFVDVVSTMLDESIPLTTGEFDEWGNPKNKDSYDYMLSYSPYDNVKVQNYPSILVTTGLHDSQVQYWEPAKWVAKLREMKTDKNLVLLRTNMDTGHGGTTGRFKIYEEIAEEFGFLLNLEGKQE